MAARILKAGRTGAAQPLRFPGDEPPRVAEPSEPAPQPEPPAAPPPEMLERARTTAAAEGFEAGRQAGLEQGQAEVRDRVARLERVLDALAAPLADLDRQVERELITLACEVGERLARKALGEAPEAMAEVVREAVSLLPASRKAVAVTLHPDDAALVRELVSDGDRREWTLAEDARLSRGDCRVESGQTEVDATLTGRRAALLDAALARAGVAPAPESDAMDDEP